MPNDECRRNDNLSITNVSRDACVALGVARGVEAAVERIYGGVVPESPDKMLRPVVGCVAIRSFPETDFRYRETLAAGEFVDQPGDVFRRRIHVQ